MLGSKAHGFWRPSRNHPVSLWTRCTAVVLVVLQFLTLGPISFSTALAAQNSTTDTRPLPDDSSASNVQVNRASPEQIKPDFSLHFSTPPKEEELEGVAMLPQPLAIIGHNPASSENAALGAALSVYFQQENKEDVRPFTGFLLEYPQSGWKASILANLGIIYRRHGYYTRALDAWNEAWQLSKDSNSVSGRAVAARSVAELARLLSSLGRTEQLKPLLAEIGHRPMYGAPASIILNAKEGLAVMQREPGMSYKCGPYALGNVQKALHPGEQVDRSISLAQSPSAGFSLVQLTQLAEKINLKYQAAKRASPGRPLLFLRWCTGSRTIMPLSSGRSRAVVIWSRIRPSRETWFYQRMPSKTSPPAIF